MDVIKEKKLIKDLQKTIENIDDLDLAEALLNKLKVQYAKRENAGRNFVEMKSLEISIQYVTKHIEKLKAQA